MYFRLRPLEEAGSCRLLLSDEAESRDSFQYILPFEFDPDVDTELQEQLEILLKSHTDPLWIVQRQGSFVRISLRFKVLSSTPQSPISKGTY